MITKLLALVIQYILLYRSVSQSNTIKFCKKHLRKTEGLIASFFIYSSKFITIGALFFYLLYIYLLIHQQNNPHSINTTPLETWTPGDILSFLLIVLGSTLRIYSIQTLGHYFTCNVEILKDHKLVTTGPYKYIRRPILEKSGIYMRRQRRSLYHYFIDRKTSPYRMMNIFYFFFVLF